MSIEAVIWSFITEKLMVNKKIEVKYDTPLIGSGILDSLNLMQLILFIEDHFGISVEDHEMLPSNFQTINSTKIFILDKLSHP